MTADSEQFYCETCDREVAKADVIRAKTMGELDPAKWQTFCCPECGNRLQTVFVGDE
jgi:Zn finger protein HypA/HybF involved in hydrogenase expression